MGQFRCRAVAWIRVDLRLAISVHWPLVVSASHVLGLELSVLAMFCSLAFTTNTSDILHLWLDIRTLDELATLQNNDSLAASFHLRLEK